MYNLWGFKLPPTVTASLWSSFLPWGRPSGSILILQWNCRPSLLLFLPSVLSSSIVAALHLFPLSHFAAVLEGPRAKERKKLWEGFYRIIFSLISLFPWVCFSAFSWLLYFDLSLRESFKPQGKLSIFSVLSEFTSSSSSCLYSLIWLYSSLQFTLQASPAIVCIWKYSMPQLNMAQIKTKHHFRCTKSLIIQYIFPTRWRCSEWLSSYILDPGTNTEDSQERAFVHIYILGMAGLLPGVSS